MPDSLRWFFGLGARAQAEAAEWRLEFQSLPSGPWLFLAAVAFLFAAWGGAWLYRREGRELSTRLRWALAGIRLLALVGVAAMLFELVAVQVWKEKIPSQLLVLMDASQSMALRDPYPNEAEAADLARKLGLEGAVTRDLANKLRGTARIDLGKKALEAIGPSLAEGREVKVYPFGGRLGKPRVMSELADLKAADATTALGEAIRDALAAHRGQPVAGVLVISDGRSNVGAEPAPIAEAAGKESIPIAALATGTPEGPRNARVTEIAANPVAFVRDPQEIPVMIESRGMKGSQALVTLEGRLEDGEWKEIGNQLVPLGDDGAMQKLVFRHAADQIGRMELRAKLTDAGPELTLDDNQLSTSMRIVRQKIRTLLIAGDSTPEVQFLKNALQRDRTLEFSGWFQAANEGYEQPGDRPLQRLPKEQRELDRYDVLVLVDPDMAALGPTWSEMLMKFVGQSGGGVVYVAGESNTAGLFNPQSEGLTIDNSWTKMLPVVRDPGLYQSSAEVALSAQETWTLELTPQGLQDPVFEFHPDPNRNKETMASLPGMYWHFPVTRAKAGATVLARHGDPRMKNNFGRHVLLATHLYGPGRVVFVGFDSTHRWRYLDEHHFDGFWARLVDRVGRSKVLGGGFPFTLATDKGAYRVGERVTITARFLNPADGARELSGLAGELEIEGQGTQPITLEPNPRDPETFTAGFVANAAGSYRLKVQTSMTIDPESGVRPATAVFRVEPPKRELDNPTLNFPLLESVARASGGTAYTLDKFGEIPGVFKQREVIRTIEESRELWNAPFLFIGVLFLLTLEWILRKRLRMA